MDDLANRFWIFASGEGRWISQERDDNSTYADPDIGLGDLCLAFLAGGPTTLGKLS
jgi:hypothetical protein